MLVAGNEMASAIDSCYLLIVSQDMHTDKCFSCFIVIRCPDAVGIISYDILVAYNCLISSVYCDQYTSRI